MVPTRERSETSRIRSRIKYGLHVKPRCDYLFHTWRATAWLAGGRNVLGNVPRIFQDSLFTSYLDTEYGTLLRKFSTTTSAYCSNEREDTTFTAATLVKQFTVQMDSPSTYPPAFEGVSATCAPPETRRSVEYLTLDYNQHQ